MTNVTDSLAKLPPDVKSYMQLENKLRFVDYDNPKPHLRTIKTIKNGY